MASPVQDGLPLESSQSRSLSLTGSTTSIGRISLVSQVDETREKSVSRISESLPHVRKRHLTHEQEVEDLEDEVKRLKMTNWTISRLTERNENLHEQKIKLEEQLKQATQWRLELEKEKNSFQSDMSKFASQSQELSQAKAVIQQLKNALFIKNGKYNDLKISEERLIEENKQLIQRLEKMQKVKLSKSNSCVDDVSVLKKEIETLNGIVKFKQSQVSAYQVLESRISVENQKVITQKFINIKFNNI